MSAALEQDSCCQALELNAAAVLVAHNHPSGVAVPSASDRLVTEQLKNAFELICGRLRDHLIVGGGNFRFPGRTRADLARRRGVSGCPVFSLLRPLRVVNLCLRHDPSTSTASRRAACAARRGRVAG
ncbi:JAB domain-containing protein [Tahibacter aquaticus]|uniref:JAB domain-containing protein n=1 Tax=Tahibacter aquaticus TaxID=520092 RepID=UPI001FB5AB90|nr:JAB domain-containing protein [Tahibacter aquaticus]